MSRRHCSPRGCVMSDLIVLGTGYSKNLYPGFWPDPLTGYPKSEIPAEPPPLVEADVWGVNNSYLFTQKMDKLFCVDDPQNVVLITTNFALVKQKFGCEVVAASKMMTANVTIYPIHEIMDHFESAHNFTNSVCYMFAYALWLHDKGEKHWDNWNMYGMDMVADGEYYKQIGGMNFWLGYAKGRGIKVHNTAFSKVAKSLCRKPGGFYGTWNEQYPGMLERSKRFTV